MAEGKFEMTRGGNLKKPDNSLMCHWIKEARYDIPREIIVKSFKTCDLNGTEDDLIWKEGSENVGGGEPAILNKVIYDVDWLIIEWLVISPCVHGGPLFTVD